MSRHHTPSLILCGLISFSLMWCPAAADAGSPGELTRDPLHHGLQLVPIPKRVEMAGGHFVFSPDVAIHLVRAKDKEDLFAASELLEELQATLGLRPAITRNQKPGSILIGRIGGESRVEKRLKGIQAALLDSIGTEGYVVQVSSGGIVVAARSGAGVFYAVQTLKQLIRANRSGNSIPCLTIVDWPALRYRGWMLDISRGPIPTMTFLKHMIATMAEYKQNCFTLYTEHVFRLKSHPDIAPADGITPEEIAGLSAFAQRYHIELIGNAQSFGHMENTLAIPFYRAMRENAWVVSPAVEATYSYLKDMYAEIMPAYSSSLFHINCDEVSGLGTGPAKHMVDSLGSSGVYAYHINRLTEILRPYGKRIMMWGDIAAGSPEIVKQLPKDLIVISWGYDGAESFEAAIMPFKSTGFDFMVSPGVSCWGQVWPNMSNAVVNISNYVRDGAALGALGMLNTIWVDDGENLFNYNWHGLLWGAECSWNPARSLKGAPAREDLESRKNAFNDAFDGLFFGVPGVTDALFEFDSLRTLPVRNLMTDQGVWSNMFELFPEEVDNHATEVNEQVASRAERLLERLSTLRLHVQRNRQMLEAAMFAAGRARFTGRKNIVRGVLAQTIQTPTAHNIGRTRDLLAALLQELHGLKCEYVDLWQTENRSWWRDRVLAKYDVLGGQLSDLGKTVFIKADSVTADGRRVIRCSTPFADEEIHYTTDGAEPTVRSAIYHGPVAIDRTSLIRARVISNGQLAPVFEKHFLVHKGVGKPSKLNSRYSLYTPEYAAGGTGALVDGLRGSDNFKDGHWQGFQGQDLDILVDLQQPTDIQRITVGFLQNSYSWIVMPERVQFWTSMDGERFTLARELVNTIGAKEEGTIVHDFTAEFESLRTRYVKVIGKSAGRLPAWHHAAGNDSFMFADEIILE